ncbi:MAG: polyprenyl synthetase family protein [Proteobacteria bacterium]|nr:polyprenyl synthetase family protein [Pseudomonadota bacterium]MDA0844379.1 polyprenyl synthetase family protein [Pseudomonadota bacterium]
MDGFLVQLGDDASACETYMKTLLDREDGPATQLRNAMAYGVLNGGKRMRAALVFGAARMASGARHDAAPTEAMLRTAAAIEFLHAYSLVHDDLPAMDDATTRRGKPSCHIEFDEATAILAGDALQTMAFEILADPRTHRDAAIRIQLVTTLAKAAGLQGMAGGQMLDLQAENRPFNLAETQQMQMMKTGALLSCAVVCGGIVGGASAKLLAAQTAFAQHLGLAFQIADDLLDYAGDASVMGKPSGQDADRGKAGFVALMGVDEARQVAQRMIADANAELAPWKNLAEYMQNLATFAITRNS